ncbi:MAG: methylated-DNA--[protein]-cysteine S-methyltransferase [Cyclobacteriaceae bacterium]|nr:methylated-DNA--[protein]-cysteine S-methyltransferase [Cyclobacteriaceae bacterium]
MQTQAELNYQRIAQAIEYLEKNFQHQPELDEIAEQVHVSPFHFQRLFTEWAGISPKRFLQYLTVDFLKSKLKETTTVVEAAEAAGLSSQSRVYDLFTTLEAVTPQEYKQRGGITIQYGFTETHFGTALIGISERGICWLSFIQTDGDVFASLEEMKTYWHNSVFRENKELVKEYVAKIFPSPLLLSPDRVSGRGVTEERGRGEGLHLFIKGTNFQIKVWEALLRLPIGHVTTYQSIANKIGNPKALQAVGSAVGANHIAYLIPCHRVIRKDGILGEYRWESVRKKSIIGWEMAKSEQQL